MKMPSTAKRSRFPLAAVGSIGPRTAPLWMNRAETIKRQARESEQTDDAGEIEREKNYDGGWRDQLAGFLYWDST